MNLENNTLLTAKELALRIKFSSGYINRKLKDNVFLEGVHYIQPFGSRKVLYLWENIQQVMYSKNQTKEKPFLIPLSSGGFLHG